MDTESRDQILFLIKYHSTNYAQRYLKVTPTKTELLRRWKKEEQLLDSELGEMSSKGLIVLSDGVYSLTSEGRKLAQQNLAREFGTWMVAREKSTAYREMCRELFGSDRCQFDMMTQVQLEKLLDVLNISNRKDILDVGCGTGALTEYYADNTGGNVTGIDFSSEAIEFAQNRTKNKQSRLSFQVMDMDEIDFPSNSFDTVLSIDTLYFVKDLYKTINALRDSLQENGQMGIFYNSKIAVDDPKELLHPEKSALAEALEKCGMQFETWEFTAEEKDFWRKGVSLANDLKNQFIEEGNLAIYESHISEATRELELIDTERKRRFLYHVRR